MLPDIAARSLAFSADGKQLASGHQYGSVRVWDVDETVAGEEINTARASAHDPTSVTAGVVSLAYSPDGKRLAAGSADYSYYARWIPSAGRKVLRSYVGARRGSDRAGLFAGRHAAGVGQS